MPAERIKQGGWFRLSFMAALCSEQWYYFNRCNWQCWRNHSSGMSPWFNRLRYLTRRLPPTSRRRLRRPQGSRRFSPRDHRNPHLFSPCPLPFSLPHHRRYTPLSHRLVLNRPPFLRYKPQRPQSLSPRLSQSVTSHAPSRPLP